MYHNIYDGKPMKEKKNILLANKKITALLLVTIIMMTMMTVILSGCGHKDADEQKFSVNEKIFTEEDYEDYCKIWLYEKGYDPTDDDESEQSEVIMDEMVDTELLRQYYEEKEPQLFESAEYSSQIKSNTDALIQNGSEFFSHNDISDESIKYYFMSGYLADKLFEEIREDYTEEALEEDARLYYMENQGIYGTISFENAQDEISYTLISQKYNKKLDKLREDASIKR